MIGIAYLSLAWRIPWGTVSQPGPGFFPLFVGGLLVLSTLGFGVLSIRRKGPPHEPLQGTARRRVIAVFVALCGFCFLLPFAGYPIAAFLFVVVMLWQLGASWVAVIGIAVVSSGVSYYFFAVVLGIPLPGGIFG